MKIQLTKNVKASVNGRVGYGYNKLEKGEILDVVRNTSFGWHARRPGSPYTYPINIRQAKVVKEEKMTKDLKGTSPKEAQVHSFGEVKDAVDKLFSPATGFQTAAYLHGYVQTPGRRGDNNRKYSLAEIDQALLAYGWGKKQVLRLHKYLERKEG